MHDAYVKSTQRGHLSKAGAMSTLRLADEPRNLPPPRTVGMSDCSACMSAIVQLCVRGCVCLCVRVAAVMRYFDSYCLGLPANRASRLVSYTLVYASTSTSTSSVLLLVISDDNDSLERTNASGVM